MSKSKKDKISDYKTNVMRLLDAAGVGYNHYSYADTDAVSGMDAAKAMGQNPEQVFKTLVTVGKSGEHYVFVIPVNAELDLKKAANAVGDKAVSMIKSKELLPLTGYIHGGCSPIGMKKPFPTYLDETAQLYDEIGVSAGQRGCQILLAPEDLINYVNCTVCDLTE